ncbi:hypothetical protein CY34DRAFT_511535 [Suillus luteus UH-Slu-Lm8-n1]|uniref:Uncharacterized protein n=1 Tax=Suillus luteus UH-Slu-Lm8-n1 TaxID=930992 RepID=A0A0D0A4C8_9AGAM|nr:hypothetical protein CY34DRAFT_511535 [Suillus luteus UH-Slu-Lm8-n1]
MPTITCIHVHGLAHRYRRRPTVSTSRDSRDYRSHSPPAVHQATDPTDAVQVRRRCSRSRTST